MFGGGRKKNGTSKGSSRRTRTKKPKQQKGEDSQNVNGNASPNIGAAGAAGQGGTQMGDDPFAEMNAQNGMPTMDETEMILLNLHSSLIDFYSKHKPENVDEDVLTILMQFFIDAGGVALNKKLMAKYGEDLNTFKKIDPDQEPPPPPMDFEYSSKTLDRVKRTSLETEYDIRLPPPPKIETTMDAKTMRKSLESHASVPSASSFDRKPKKKRVIDDPELRKYKAGKDKEVEDLSKVIDEHLFGEPQEDPSLRLDLLDLPNDKQLTPRDLIEAFYSKHDEAKLDRDTGIEKFVMWVEQHSLEELSNKLKGKYNEGLFEQEKLARRRRNLEDLLTQFYLKHDRPKLDTRWTILKILSWTMVNGVIALNRKFITRYGFPVVEIELDI